MDLAIVPATTGVASIRSLVRAYDLEAALDCLPSAAELTIAPQTDVPSEHPFKLLIGTHDNDRVWIGLTTTPKHASGPGFKIFITAEDTITSHTINVLDKFDLVQPFRRLWERTSVATGIWTVWYDKRRGMLKSFAYWYLLIEAERIGRILLVPDSIRRYLVEGLKMVGVEAYSVEERVLRGNVSTKEHDLRKERDTFKRQHAEIEDEEQEPKRRSRRIKQAPQRYSNPWPTASKRPKGRQVTSHGTSGVEVEAGSDYPNVDFEDGDNAFTPALQGPSQGNKQMPNHERPSPSASIDDVTQPDEFEKLKEMMAAHTALHAEYRCQLAKAEALKQQLEEHKDTIRKAMAEAVATWME